MAVSEIVNESFLPRIQQALDQLSKAESEIGLAKRAGITELPNGASIEELAKQVSRDRSALLQLKNVYFPGS